MAYVEPYGKSKLPVSMHPAFPAIVALWFAVLFGLGSLVLPPVLLERAVAVTGIDALIPAAAPPLGTTARIAIAAAMALVGAMLGFVIARRVASAQAAARPARSGGRPYDADMFQDVAIRRPISARDELGATQLETPPLPEHEIDEPDPPLAPIGDDRPDLLLRPAQYAGLEAGKASVAEFQTEPLDLARFERPQPLQLRDPGLQQLSPVARPFASTPAMAPPETARPAPIEPATPFGRTAAIAAPSPAALAARDTVVENEPLAFHAPSQADREASEPQAGEDEAKAPAQMPREPLDQLSMADLAERLAGSLGRMGGAITPPSAGLAAALGAQLANVSEAPVTAERIDAPVMEPTPESRDLAPARFVGRLHSQPVPPPPVIPAALRPLPFEADEFGDDDDELDLNLNFAKSAMRAAAPSVGTSTPLDEAIAMDDEEEEADEDDPVAQSAAFGSLLAMRGPSRGSAGNGRAAEPETALPEPQSRRFDTPGKFAAIEAPSAVRPGVDREEAERALRSALATLQRMSGAA